MALGFKKLGVVSVWMALLAVALFVAFSPKNESSEERTPASSNPEEAAPQKEVAVPVNFGSPLYTKPSALVCPLAVAVDPRERYGLKAAMEAHLSIFGHQDAVEKLGCEEWREGVPVSLTAAGQKQATEWDREDTCGMVAFADGYVFSCDLRNASGEEVVKRGEDEIADAMQNPSKVRLMECIGVNPWKVKPAGWTPPTDEECAALRQKLGVAADAKAAAPDTGSEDVASLIAEEEKLNGECRGSSGDDHATSKKVCDERDVIFGRIRAKNWCWGHDGQAEADRDWEPCPDSSAKTENP